ncbi:MAG: CPBP family intramembrane glutamic endopeptidase [bacterium]|nr:CPBP family intramembrane metalloprotease [Candidatus Sumerlaeota bacterium]
MSACESVAETADNVELLLQDVRFHPSPAWAIGEIVILSLFYFVCVWIINPYILDPGVMQFVVISSVLMAIYYIWFSPCMIHGDAPDERGLGERHTFFVRMDNLAPALRLFGTSSLVMGASLIIGALMVNPGMFSQINWRLVCVKQCLYLSWASFQGLLFFGFFMVRLRGVVPMDGRGGAEMLSRHRLTVVFITALIFSVFHMPNLPMMGLTLVGGFAWGWIYYQYPNLLALVLSHSVIGTILNQVIHLNMRAGPSYWTPDRYVIRMIFPFIAQWMSPGQ